MPPTLAPSKNQPVTALATPPSKPIPASSPFSATPPLSLRKNLTYSVRLSSLQPLCQSLPSLQPPAHSFLTVPSISNETMCRYNAIVFNVPSPSSMGPFSFCSQKVLSQHTESREENDKMKKRLSRVMSRKVVLLYFDEVVQTLTPDAVARYKGTQGVKARRLMWETPSRIIP